MSAHLCARRISENVTVQNLGKETLIYDETRHKAFCLNEISGLVWKLADGTRTTVQIADAASSELVHPVTEEIVRFALGQLQSDGLLQTESLAVDLAAISRRELVVKLGKGAALMLPVVTAVFTPRLAKAQQYGGGCLLPNTLVQLQDGSEVEVRDVAVNQWLRGVDPGTGEYHAARVVQRHSFTADRLLTFTTETGELVQSSPSHLFIAGPGDEKGTRAINFRTGDSLLVFKEGMKRTVSSRITSIETSMVPQEVQLFELDTPQHCFLSGGVVSHNVNIK